MLALVRRMLHRTVACIALAANVVTPASGAPTHFEGRPSPQTAVAGPVRVWIRNAVLYPYRDAPATVIELRGSVVPMRAGRPIVFDDIGSYGLEVASARVQIDPRAMTVLMNRVVLPAAKIPIEHVDVTFGSGTVGLSGIVVRGAIRARFRATATVAPTPAGELRLSVKKMTVAGFVSKRLMDALGLTIQHVAPPRDPDVLRVSEDDLIVPLASMFPPPRIGGRVRAVRVEPGRLIATIGAPNAGGALPSTAPSFVAFRQGTLRFARLTMRDSDLTLLPAAGESRLGFSPAAYYRQLEAGVTFVRPNGALVARVPDYRSIPLRAGP